MNDIEPGLKLAALYVTSKIDSLTEMKENIKDPRALDNLESAILVLEQISGRISRALGPVS